jgi:hypothetical protein
VRIEAAATVLPRRAPRFSAAIAASLACMAMMGVYVFITHCLQLVLGLTPLAAGIATLPLIVLAFAAILSTRMLRVRSAPAA